MTTPAQARGTSLAVRLLALVVVPMLALSLLAVQRIGDERAAAHEATALVDAVELQQAVASVYPHAQVEQIALEGLALIDELGWPRGVVAAFSGVDLETMFRANEAELDRALDHLTNRYGDLVLGSGQRLENRVTEVRVLIDLQRDRSQRRVARGHEVNGVFEQLHGVLDDVLGQLRASRTSDGSTDMRRIQLALLGEVVVSAGERAQVQLRSLLYQTEQARENSAALGAIHEALLESYRLTVDPDQRADFDAIVVMAAALPDMPVSETDSGDDGVANLDPKVIAASADVALAQFDYLHQVAGYSTDFHALVVDDAERSAAEARAEETRTTWLLAAIAAITAILIGYVLVSTVAPIRKLTRRAEAISQGQLDHEPLRVGGPRDLRALITTTNDMVDTLHQMQDEVSRLASGDVDPNSTPDLPGAIGISMRESMRRLASVTGRLKRSEQFSSAIVARAADAIWTVDDHGRIRSANSASEVLTGCPAGDQLGQPLSSFLTSTRGEATVTTADGQTVPVLTVDSTVDVDDERITIVIAHDISERARYEARLAYQASHDALTGLPNRFSLLSHLDRCLVDHHDVAVLFVDLDGFKNINDTKGHAVGDQVLSAVAERLRGCVAGVDFIGRLGGDEFVIVTSHNDVVGDTVAFGEWVIRAIEQPHHIGGESFSLSASIGVAFPPIGTTALDTLRQADNAVYQAKRRGRGRVEIFDAAMQERIDHEADLELALRHAVGRDELSVHLQPVLDLATGRIVSAEALARWHRPSIGPVSPDEFIPIAERTSLIFDVERWMLKRVCEQLVDWRRRDPNCRTRIAVNISGRHLIDGELIVDVDEALAITGVDPTMLELELTETHLLDDHGRATRVLESLRRRGISIAIDDFGTGYSSLTYLRHLPIDLVKIDRSFVARVTENGYDATIIEALLTISRRLNLVVVAEGVETHEQLEFLRARGCDRAQGFLIARPGSVAATEPMILTEADLWPMERSDSGASLTAPR